MTPQELLLKISKESSSHKDNSALEAQRNKTAQLLAANKAAAQNILKGALEHLESSTPAQPTEIVKRIWI